MRSIVGRILLVALLIGCMSAQENTTCALPDCDQAKVFFQKFQQAVNEDQRQEAASLVSYPLQVYRNGKATVLGNKTQLLAKYDSVFDPPTRCAIKSATADDVWGNWRGFTVAQGVIWWDRTIPKSASSAQLADMTKYPFGVFSVNHSGPLPKGCPQPLAHRNSHQVRPPDPQ